MNVSNETVPPGTAVPLDNRDFCPADRPYPATYYDAVIKNVAACQAEDPCLPEGTTLWMMQPCDATPTSTTVVVAVADPPVPASLPSTGRGFDMAGGTIMILVGIVCLLVSRRKRA